MQTQNAPSRPSRTGFTMIELLTVIAVVGIMMSIVVPRMRITATTEAQLAGMQLAQDIDLTRTRALSTRSRARVSFTTGTSASYTGYLDTDGDSTITESNEERLALQAFGTQPLPPRMTIGRGSASSIPGDVGSGSITLANSRVEFDSRGLPTPMGTSGTVYLRQTEDPSAVVAVAVSPSGGVRLWTWRGGSWQ